MLRYFADFRKRINGLQGLLGHGNKSGTLRTSYVFPSLWFYPEDPVLDDGASPPEAFNRRKSF